MMRKIAVVSILVMLVVLLTTAVTPSAAQTAGGACPGAPLPRLLYAGTQARPAQSFSTLWASPTSSVVITTMYRANNDTFTIVSGPTCSTGPFNWYQVTFKGISGWVTEGTGDTYWVEPVAGTGTAVPPTGVAPTPTRPSVTTVPPTPTGPPTTPVPNTGACPGAPTPRLKIGGNARPAQAFSSLRSALDSDSIIKVLYRANNDVFSVVAGPYCGHGPHNWWQVDYKGTVGWVTEGEGSTYWVEPTT